jgi:hypothetical protein
MNSYGKRIPVDTDYINNEVIKGEHYMDVAVRLGVSTATVFDLQKKGVASEATINKLCSAYGADFDRCFGKKEEPTEVPVEKPTEVPVPASKLEEEVKGLREDINILVNKLAEIADVNSTLNEQMHKVYGALINLGQVSAEANENNRKFQVVAQKFFTEYKNNKKYGTW